MSRFDEIYPLFREYDMFAQTIEVVKEPNVYKAMTPYGSFVCKRTAASPNRLLHISGVLRHLQHRGWEGAVPFYYTKYDEPYIQQGKTVFYLTQWQPGVVDISAQPLSWAGPAVDRLAELHHLTQNYRFDDPRQVEPLIDSLLKRWEYWLKLTEESAETVRCRTYPSPFDVVFLANQAFVMETAKTAIRLLCEWRERHRTYAHFRLSIIHGYPHPAHIALDNSGRGRLLNFDRALFDTPVRDLTMFYRTYFQLAGEEAGASHLFRRYTAIFPLRPEEINLLAAFLSYPERVMRDIEIYYCKKRDWSELYAVKRFEKDIDRLMRLNRWVHQAF
ncbi:phosphotransferase [Brevibacillus sp. H7]|jgi:spore coat protein YsxE|uniref:phosphotransferase n=1 Tax=Brevibacillus sp. H7 TaxID=3349138 RepID=UPI003824ACB6